MKKLFFIFLLLFLSFNSGASPKILKWKGESGVNVLYSHSSALPIVDIRIIFAAGGARDQQMPGIARMTNALISEGAHGASANEIAEKFDEVGARFSSGSARDMAWIDLRSLSEWEKLSQGIDLVNMMLTDPDFNEDSIQRIKKQMLVGLDGEKQSPGAIAKKEFYQELYNTHPYGVPVNGTEKSITEISREDIRAFYKKYYVSENATVAIVGDIDGAAAAMIVESIFAGVNRGKKAEKLPKAKHLAKSNVVEVEFDSSQTHIYIGQIGIDRYSEDYFPLMVGNHILGGGSLISMLGQEVRVKNGLTYGIYSAFIPMLVEGPFFINCQTRAHESDKALDIINKTLSDFIKNGPSEERLIAAKKNITGEFPLGLASNSSIASYLGSIGFYDLPLDYLKTYQDKVNAVTVSDIKKSFSKTIDREKLLIVKVGPQFKKKVKNKAEKKLEKKLEKK